MNNKAQLSFVYFFVVFLIILVVFSFIQPLKDILSASSLRGGTGLNCVNTADFNDTAYGNQTAFQRLVYRPTCVVTGLSIVWLVGVVLFSAVTWAVSQWRKGMK